MRMISLAGLGLLLAALGAATTATRAAGAAHLSVELSNGLLSLDAEDVPLQAILDEIGRVSGVPIHVSDADASPGDTLTTLLLERVRVDEAVQRLLMGRSFVLVYATGALREARVYEAPPSASARTPEPEGADVARLRGAALADPDPRERARALEDLAANLDQRAALDAVVEVLGRESNPGLLERALDIVGSERALPLEPVLRLAASNPEPRVRIKALTRLSEQAARDVRARQALEVAAADDSAPAVRDTAAKLLRDVAPK